MAAISRAEYQIKFHNLRKMKWPGSVVSIATGYGLEGPVIESRWGERFFAPIQIGPGAHPASCTMGTWSLPGIKSGRGVTRPLTPFSCRGHERVELYLYSPLWAVRPVQSLSACTRVHFTMEKKTLTIRVCCCRIESLKSKN